MAIPPGPARAATAPLGSLGRRVAVGAAFMVAMRFAFRGIGLVNTLILVRFLTPTDFGIVGFATLAFSVLDQLSDLSSGLALIRMENPRREHYDTAWTLGILRGCLCALLFAASAPILASFIHEPRVRTLSYVIAALAMLQSCENPGMVDLQRDLRFDRLFWCGVISKVLGTAACIAVAVLMRSYWALMAGIVIGRVASLALSYVASRYRPRFALAAWRELLNFSKWMLIVNIQNLIDSYATVFTIGRMNGAAAIGYYQVAYQIAALPVSEVAAPARQPIYAGYARVAHDPALLRQQFLDGFGLIFLLVTPACVGVALLAEPITHLFLGQQWMIAVDVVALCAFYALFDSVAHFCTPLFFVLHRERSFVHIFSVVLAFRVPGMILGVYLYGVEGAVFAMMVTAVLNLVLWLWRVAPLIELGVRQVVRAVWRTVAGTCVMAGVVWISAAHWAMPQEEAAGLLRFACLCSLGAAVHFAVQFSLWVASGMPGGAETTIVNVTRAASKRLSMRRRFSVPA